MDHYLYLARPTHPTRGGMNEATKVSVVSYGFGMTLHVIQFVVTKIRWLCMRVGAVFLYICLAHNLK